MTLAGALGGPQSPHNVGPKGDDYAMVSNAENKTTITVGPKGDECLLQWPHMAREATRKVQLQGPKEAMNMTTSLPDGTDTYDHFQRDGHDPMTTSQGPGVQYSHIGNY
ncbi:hypothetical protein BaRGS_00028533 [Batillaria attramentaria]|uniref:Uncharacterized protein n=1 Tax=Batillaria attramentaria TaxID=370345 RepID=A0ABD0JZW8_9CAEN